MRKPRDYDSELKAISQRAKQLQERKLRQLGELVVATGADALPIEELAGALIAARDADVATKGEWRMRGAAFFQRSRRHASPASAGASSASTETGGDSKTRAREAGA